jgi:tetratricopeptide (TPR) repeat protein
MAAIRRKVGRKWLAVAGILCLVGALLIWRAAPAQEESIKTIKDPSITKDNAPERPGVKLWISMDNDSWSTGGTDGTTIYVTKGATVYFRVTTPTTEDLPDTDPNIGPAASDDPNIGGFYCEWNFNCSDGNDPIDAKSHLDATVSRTFTEPGTFIVECHTYFPDIPELPVKKIARAAVIVATQEDRQAFIKIRYLYENTMRTMQNDDKLRRLQYKEMEQSLLPLLETTLSNDKRARVYEALGDCFYMKGDYKKANEYFTQGLELANTSENTHASLHIKVGDALRASGDKEAAIAAYESITREHVNIVNYAALACLQIGRVREEQGQYNEAIRQYHRVLQEYPTSGNVISARQMISSAEHYAESKYEVANTEQESKSGASISIKQSKKLNCCTSNFPLESHTCTPACPYYKPPKETNSIKDIDANTAKTTKQSEGTAEVTPSPAPVQAKQGKE